MGEFDPAPGAAVVPPEEEFAPAPGAEIAPPAAPQALPAAPQPSFLRRVAGEVAAPFKAIGNTLLSANQAVVNAISHPVDTFNAVRAHPAAATREFMRGVNDNIPFANRAVAALPGGAPETSPEDAALFPNARAAGGVAGAIPAGDMLGGIAGKAVEKAAPVVARAVEGAGESAVGRQVGRAKEALELKVNKGTRAALKSDAVGNAIAENPELRKAAGNDVKVAAATERIKASAAAKLKPIYAEAGPADEAVATAVSNIDARIAELRKGDVNSAAAARKLQTLRDEFNTRLGERGEVSASDLRAEQSAYQRNGYAKNIAKDPEVDASILAQREMSKAVGDALVQHVTGMDYAAAKAAAAADPSSLAAKLFKANEQITAANKIEAGIADRAGRVQQPHGLGAAVKRIAGHTVLPAVVGATHGAHAGIAAAALQEALHAAPAAARAVGGAADAAIAGAAPSAAAAIRGAGAAAAGGTPLERIRAAAAAGNQRAARLLSVPLRTPIANVTPAGTVTAGTLASSQ